MQRVIADVFGVAPNEPLKADVKRAQDRQNLYVFWYYTKKNKAGGQALFLPVVHPWLMDFEINTKVQGLSLGLAITVAVISYQYASLDVLNANML